MFDENSFMPYHELDEVNPIGVYGSTKRLGELAVINSNIDAIVIRLFGCIQFTEIIL